MIISKIFLLVFMFILLVFGIFAQQSRTNEKIISLQGKVQSFDGQPIPNYEIILESEEGIVRTKTDEQGKYSAVFPGGIYKIFTQATILKLDYKDDVYIFKDDFSYFRPYRRAKIDFSNFDSRKDSNEVYKATLNIVLIESDSFIVYDPSETISGKFRDDSYNLTSKIKYETINLDSSDNSLDLVIQYRDKEKNKEEYVYNTKIWTALNSIFGKKYPFTVLTYDKLTIYGEKVYYNEKKKRLRVENAIVIDLGKYEPEQKEVKEVVIDFKNKNPIFRFKN